MSELKTVGDCIKLCDLVGIKTKHFDGDLFEVAGIVQGFITSISNRDIIIKELQKEIDWLNEQLTDREIDEQYENGEIEITLSNSNCEEERIAESNARLFKQLDVLAGE